jgi:hypothetical protein
MPGLDGLTVVPGSLRGLDDYTAAAIAAGDLGQAHVLLTPADLQHVFATYDGQWDSWVKSISMYGIVRFDYDSVVASIAFVLLFMITFGPVLLTAWENSSCRVSRRGSSRRRLTKRLRLFVHHLVDDVAYMLKPGLASSSTDRILRAGSPKFRKF